jgi:E3 ubiquitin-protein ligase UBR1
MFDGSGICDCGDSEAWTKPFACKSSKHERGTNENEDLPDDLKASIEETIRTVLDFAITIFSTEETGLKRSPTPEQVKRFESNGILEKFTDENDDKKSTEIEMYVLCLWNDEVHSFTEVIELLTTYCEKTENEAENIANMIDNYGKAQIAISKDIDRIFEIQEGVSTGGLSTSIRSTRDYLREEISDEIFHWLLDFSECSLPGLAAFVRDTISKLLLATDWNPGVSTPSRTSLDATCLMDDFTFPESGKYPLTDVDIDNKVYQPIPQPESASNSDINFPTVIPSRANYLLFFDIRLWKNVRSNIRDLFISTMVSDPKNKVVFGVHFSTVYPNIIEHFLIAEREPNLSLVSQLSTQLFTAPSVTLEITKNGNFPSILLQLVYSFILYRRTGKPPHNSSGWDKLPEDLAAFQNHGIGSFFYDLNHFLTRLPKKTLLLEDKNFLPELARLLMLFNDAIVEKRALLQHVEYERRDWPYLFYFYNFLLSLVDDLFKGFGKEGIDKSKLFDFLTYVARKYLERTFENSSLEKLDRIFDAPIFRKIIISNEDDTEDIDTLVIERNSASWFHPFEFLLSILFARAGADKKLLEDSMINAYDVFENGRLTKITVRDSWALMAVFFHNTWKTLSFISQIDASLWVRNGQVLKLQSSHYRHQYKSTLYMHDIYWAQVGLTLLHPDDVFIRLMHYWDVINWPLNFHDNLHAVYMMESFLHYLIIFLSDRSQLLGLSEEDLKQKHVEREIIQTLGFRPTSFEVIAEEISLKSSEELLEPTLKKIATFKPPVGIHDVGTYTLKPEYTKILDTHYMSFNSSEIEEATKIVKALNKKTNPEQNFAEPHLESLSGTPFVNIGAFLTTKSFNQFLFKLLYCLQDDFCGSNHYEPILSYLLRLLLVAGKNDLQTDFSDKRHYDVNENSFAAMMCVEIDTDFDMGRDFAVFFPQSTDKNVANSPILMLFHMHQSPLYKDYKGELYGVLTYLFKKAPETINNYFTSRLGNSFEHYFYSQKTEKSSKSNKSEKNKARLKQDKALAKILKKQRLFAETHNVDKDSKDNIDNSIHSHEEVSDWKYPAGECILCRTPCDSSNGYGVIGRFETTISTAYIGDKLGYLVLDGSDYTTEFDEAEPESGLIPTTLFPADKRYKTEKGDISFHKRGQLEVSYDENGCLHSKVVFVSCGHILHQKCYDDYTKRQSQSRHLFSTTSSKSTMCPLCHFFGDVFTPILWETNSRSYENDCNTEESFRYFINCQCREIACSDSEWQRRQRQGLATSIVSALNPKKKLTGYNALCYLLENVAHPCDFYSRMINTGLSSKVSKFKNIDENELDNFSLVGLLTTSIADVEHSLRGVGRKPGELSVLDQIPERVVTNLRLLAEHSRTLVFLTILNPSESCEISPNFKEMKQRFDSFGLSSTDGMPFDRLAESIFLHTDGLGISPRNLIQNYLIGEICRALNSYCLALKTGGSIWKDPNIAQIPTIGEPSQASLANLKKLILLLSKASLKPVVDIPHVISIVYSLLLRTITIFLRKTAILIHAIYAKDFNDSSKLDESNMGKEADKLCKLLGISSFDYYLDMMANDLFYGGIVKSWIEGMDYKSYQLEFPGILKMVKLPERLDEFFALPQIKEILLNAYNIPVVCLFCGDIISIKRNGFSFGFNFNAKSCKDHLKTCQQDTGLFLLPKENYILVVSHSLMAFVDAPYLDVHGNSKVKDLPMILYKQRYDYINRTLWLQHTVLDELIRRGGYI